MRHRIVVVGLVVPLLLAFVACTETKEPTVTSGPWSHVPTPARHKDHSSFFTEPFEDGPSVTRACLSCHPDSATQVMATPHWQWEGEETTLPGREEKVKLGKKHSINNFCIGVESNWPSCTRCHVGYGWEDENFDFSNEEAVDCLTCHDNSGTYIKGTAGNPADGVDLLAAARSVGRPDRKSCGNCHFNGGGGNAVKHGDLDESMLNPAEHVDFHMGTLDMVCVDCHQTTEHKVPGRAISVSADDNNRTRCTDCHDEKPHRDNRLNLHTDRIACQTCHIPYMAVDTPTKMEWNWSDAGQDLDIDDTHLYMKIKGSFVYERGIAPEYYWYNGTSTHYIVGDKMDPTGVTHIAAPIGSIDDKTAKLWPFKVHRGDQIYDVKHRHFIVPNTVGPDGYWTKFDWDLAARNGSKAVGLDYSGEYGFAKTDMHWPLSHMVTDKADALQCRDCHGANGRLNWSELGYKGDPLGKDVDEHDAVPLLDADENDVRESGQPLSLTASCGQCHELDDDEFIAKHGYHKTLTSCQSDAISCTSAHG